MTDGTKRTDPERLIRVETGVEYLVKGFDELKDYLEDKHTKQEATNDNLDERIAAIEKKNSFVWGIASALTFAATLIATAFSGIFGHASASAPPK